MPPLSNRTHSIGRSIGGWVGTGLIGSTLLVISPAAAANTLSAWQFDPVSRQFTVTLPQGVTPRFVVAAEPARIILEIPQTRLGPVETEATYDGPVSVVRLAQVEGGTLQVVLELAPGVVLDSNHAQLTSMAAGDQTRWVLTPLVTAAGTVTARSTPLDIDQADDRLNAAPAADIPAPTAEVPSTPEMVVELPVIPAPEPGLGFPEAGQGRLSTTAANLMLPSDLDGLENLPETLPIDPFAIGMADSEAVTVPGLDELDAEVGPLATGPQVPQPAAADANVLPDAETSAVRAGLETEGSASQSIADMPPTAAAAAEDVPMTESAAGPVPQPEAPLSDDGAEIITVQPQVASQNRATPPESTGVIAVAPPAREAAPAESTVAGVGDTQDVLMVPELPATTSTEPVVPPGNAPANELVMAALGPINFGQPLPGAEGKAVNETMDIEAVPAENQPVPPDILIAAGTVLQLRYPGNQPLVLAPGTDLNEVMLLESEIRDPITQGVLAPRGSQLIGQFQPNGTNQQWVSEMIIVPAGQRVPLASTSETLIGSPQVDSGRLAAGTGAGALALALLTGFSGIGLIGGAIVGATTMVGTSPQQVVIEPNQIIAVQVTENVPRAMPIASGPDLSREWGAAEWVR